MQPLEPVPLDAIEAARERLRGVAVRTPLVRLDVATDTEIYLKLENLQPIGSFKIRGAGNALAAKHAAVMAKGVYTASAGNMGQGIAWNAKRLGVTCHVVVPDNAPQTKLDALARLDALVIKVPYDEWWRVLMTHHYPGLDAVFVHPVSDPDVMAGNGTIGLEILDDLPAAQTILVPYGGGGLSCGIASAVRGRGHAAAVLACEVDTAAPLAASFAAGRPMAIEHRPSFVDGIGGKSVLEEMWPVARAVLGGTRVAPLAAVADAVRVLVERNHVVAEGAGAASVAVALAGTFGPGPVVCVVSGGNIDATVLATILEGETPAA